jgi:Tfp pilus assembly protein PilO
VNKKVIAMATVASVVLVAIWYVAIFSSQSKSITKAHTQVATASSDAATLRAAISTLQQEKSHLSDSTAKLAALKLLLPDAPALDKLIDQVNAVASQAGVDWQVLTPAKPATYAAGSAQAVATGFPGGMQSVSVAMQAKGGYKQVTDFVSKLTTISRLLDVDSVNIANGTGAQPTQAQITTQMFFVPSAAGSVTTPTTVTH